MPNQTRVYERYEITIGQAEELFKKLTARRYSNPGKFDEDRNTFGQRFNDARSAIKDVMKDGNIFDKLSAADLARSREKNVRFTS